MKPDPHAILNHIAEGEDLRWTRAELKAALVAFADYHAGEFRAWQKERDALIDKALKAMIFKVTQSKTNHKERGPIERLKGVVAP